jgi:3-hydroxyisobutyrate dehydrogenase
MPRVVPCEIQKTSNVRGSKIILSSPVPARERRMVAFLGTGLLGTGFIRAALKRGEQVNVWNRTLDKAAVLGKDGAKVFPAIADAVRGAERVHLVLSDDEAVEAVIKQILPELGKDVTVVDHTTTSVSGALARTQNLAGIGVCYQHAPVFMAPLNALESTGVMLISGEQVRYEKLSLHLSPMTGKLLYLGVDPGRAAAMKLAGNLMLMAVTTGLADMAAFLKAMDVPRQEIENLFEHFNPGASVQPRAKRMLGGKYENPSWELKMARKDARLILTEAEKHGASLGAVPAYAAMMDHWLKKGFGEHDWTVIGKDAVS